MNLSTLLASESYVRLGTFVSVLTVMLAWELLAPLREQRERPLRHDIRNLSILLLDGVTVRLLLPILPVGLAVIATERGWGLFNNLEVAGWLAVLLTVVLLDLAIYLQHVVFHAVPVLWRIHMVHHTDLDFGATTGVRFHPLEILLSAGIKLGLVVILGPPAVGVMLFEVLLNGSAVFSHANVHIPGGVDRPLRWIVVTPDMHRVHHSVERAETNSNFGFNLPWWDRLFGTYRDRPQAGQLAMVTGLEHHRDRRLLTFGRLLMLPFRETGGRYPISGKKGEDDAGQ